MRSKIKVFISAAVAAALSIGVAASAESQAPEKYDYEGQRISSHARQTPVTEEEKERFEELLLLGLEAHDPCFFTGVGEYKVAEGTDISDKLFSQDSTDIKLNLVHDELDGTYRLWSGRFVVDDVSSFSSAFYEPYTFDCQVGGVTYMHSAMGYSDNYKEVNVVYKYLNNGNISTQTYSNEGVGLRIPVSTKQPSGRVVEARYYFYLHVGNISTTPNHEVAFVHVVDKEYANSEEFASLPYAHLIDRYTYVDTSEISAMPPMDNNA